MGIIYERGGMDLNALKIFVLVARSGSFSAAARDYDMPLPTISRKITELEKQTNKLLFERTSRGCLLTEAGQKLLSYASSAMDIINDAEQILLSSSSRITGHLRLTIPQSLEPWWELLRQFQRAYPSIAINIHATERRVDLTSESIDVALRVGTIADDSVVIRHLMDFRHLLVASPTIFASAPQPHKPSELKEYPCAAWASVTGARPVWMLGNYACEVPAIFTVNDYLHLRAGALMGEYITELPSFFAAEFINTGKLIALLQDFPLPYSSLHLVYKRQGHISAAARAYIEFCTDNIALLSDRCFVKNHP